MKKSKKVRNHIKTMRDLKKVPKEQKRNTLIDKIDLKEKEKNTITIKISIKANVNLETTKENITIRVRTREATEKIVQRETIRMKRTKG
jgi:hypothetical protein